MDVKERRSLLETIANPGPRIDYVVFLDGAMALADASVPAMVEVRYIPDRAVLKPEAFVRYLSAMGEHRWDNLEAVAVAMLEDLGNEVVARWLQVALSAPGDDRLGLTVHRVLLEDRQPRWDNPALLARLRRL